MTTSDASVRFSESFLTTAAQGQFSLREARRIVGEHFVPNSRIYWTDFLLSWTIGLLAFRTVRQPYTPWWLAGICFIVSCLLFYRSGLFIHELVHLRAGTFRTFRLVWNLLCGIPFLIPSFVYYTHLDHHRRKHYATEHDGEYIPLSGLPRWQILFYLSQCFVIPPLVVLRFGMLTPLTWLHPSIRRVVHRRASSMIMDPTYIRPLPTQQTLRIIRWQELACFCFVIGSAMSMVLGIVPRPLYLLVQSYATAVVIVLINQLRTLGAHRWLNVSGRQMTFVEQLIDSVNYSRRPILNGLWAPVGLRFHALHHLFPSMPYHALATAHRRLIEHLPADSLYRITDEKSLTTAIGRLWQRAGFRKALKQKRSGTAVKHWHGSRVHQ